MTSREVCGDWRVLDDSARHSENSGTAGRAGSIKDDSHSVYAGSSQSPAQCPGGNRERKEARRCCCPDRHAGAGSGTGSGPVRQVRAWLGHSSRLGRTLVGLRASPRLWRLRDLPPLLRSLLHPATVCDSQHAAADRPHARLPPPLWTVQRPWLRHQLHRRRVGLHGRVRPARNLPPEQVLRHRLRRNRPAHVQGSRRRRPDSTRSAAGAGNAPRSASQPIRPHAVPPADRRQRRTPSPLGHGHEPKVRQCPSDRQRGEHGRPRRAGRQPKAGQRPEANQLRRRNRHAGRADELAKGDGLDPAQSAAVALCVQRGI